MRVCSKVNSKINSLQGLRFVACICVFGAHTAIKELTPFLGGGRAVLCSSWCFPVFWSPIII